MSVFIIVVAAVIAALVLVALRIHRRGEPAGLEEALSDESEMEGEETETGEDGEEAGEADSEEGEATDERVDLELFGGEAPTQQPEPQPVEEVEVEFDPLCDVKVGQGFRFACQRALSYAHEVGEAWGVLAFDIDRFRFINSLRGVSLGDYAISRLVQEMQNIFPERAVVTRISGDHFAACFPLAEPGDLEFYSEQLLRAADNIRGDIGMKSGMRLCFGSAATYSDGYDIDLLVQKANIARHCIKTSKAENLAAYNDTMVTSFLFGESALEDYSDNQYGDEFVLYFQPQSDISRSIISAVQVLVRWVCVDTNSKELAVMPENGKIPTNGGKVLYHSLRELNRWRKTGKELLPAMVYLPATDFFKKDIDALFVKCLTEFSLTPRQVIPVVSASALCIHPDMARLQLQKFADVGIRVAVDGILPIFPDFSALTGMPLSFVKIPRAITAQIDRIPQREERLRAIHGAVTGLGLVPVYEGIDDVNMMGVVQEMGGYLVEGKYAGKAVLSEDFTHALQEYVQRRKGYDSTVILDNGAFARGEYKL